jgi:mutual gliding-motility protein MglA
MPPAADVVRKVVFCGPGMAGKTTNLETILRLYPGGSGPIATDLHSERTLHVLVDVPSIGRLALWTVPGVSYYAATRRAVLQDAAAVVFVADSRREAMDENIDAMNEMLANVRQLGLGDDLPVVLQYNKCDTPTAVAPEQLEPLLNIRAWPHVRAVAANGQGVAETLRLVLDALARRSMPDIAPVPLAELPAPARTWLITCHHCQMMLEVPAAEPGMVYTCGSCQNAVEVVDGERGVTRAPVAAPRPVSHTSLRPARDDSGGYAATSSGGGTGSGSGGVQALAARPPTQPIAYTGGPVLPGFEVVALLDESPLGTRTRVREVATGRTGRSVAVHPAVLALAGYRDQLDPYIRLAGPIRHPHLLPMNAFYPLADGNAVLLSQDAADFEHLGHVLARRRIIAPPHAIHIVRQIALVLEEAARAGVVHGWLRPESILIGADGQVLLDDLCLPKPHRHLVRELAGASAATEYYLAPEHLGDETRSDLRSDIFCLGALLFRMITGDGLVTGYNPHEALHKLIANGARPLRAAGAPVSRELDNFYKRLVATERKERFQTWREVIEHTERFGGGAKRQTMKITGALAAGRTTPGNRRMPSTGARRGDSSGGGLRPARGLAPPPQARPSRPAAGMGAGVWAALVICLVALGGGLAYMVLRPTAKPVVRAAPAAAPAPAAASPAPIIPDVPPTPPLLIAPLPAPVAEPVAVETAPGVAPDTTPEAAPAAPVTPLAPRPDGAGMSLPTLREAIGTALVSQRYGEALALARSLPEGLRAMNEDNIQRQYKGKRGDLERLAAAGSSPRLEAAVAQVATWGMDAGDVAWAQQLVATAAARPAPAPAPVAPKPVTPRPVPATPAAPTTPSPAPVAEPVTPAAPAPGPAPDPARDALLAAHGPLMSGSLSMIRNAANGLRDPASAKALTRLADLGARRIEVLSQAITAQARLRIQHPVTREECDVSGVDDSGLTLTNAGGGVSQVAWSNLSDRAGIGMLWSDALAAGSPTPQDRATAAAMLAANGQAAFAKLALRPARASLDADLLADLDLLIGLAEKR